MSLDIKQNVHTIVESLRNRPAKDAVETLIMSLAVIIADINRQDRDGINGYLEFIDSLFQSTCISQFRKMDS